MQPIIHDALIIGGGPAGWASALGLCRVARSSILFDSNSYRNSMVTHFHTYPTRDHTSPAVLRADARKEVEGRYEGLVQVVERKVVGVEKGEGEFEVKDEKGGTWRGRMVVMAVGSRDVLPELEGYAENWGSRIHQCLFCDGFEYKSLSSLGASAGILCLSPTDLEYTLSSALTALRFVPSLKIYTNGSLSSTELEDKRFVVLESKGVVVDERPLSRLEALDDDSSPAERIRVHLFSTDDDDEPTNHTFLIHKPSSTLSTHGLPLARSLNLALTPGGDIQVTPQQSTSVEGVFAAGDCADPLKQVVRAAAGGVTAAAMGHHGLLKGEWGV